MMQPWLLVPLAEYECHMNATDVEQLAPLAELFALALAQAQPRSVAILGIAGGNGLAEIDPATTGRIVGFDINPTYLDAVRERYSHLPNLELHCVDLAAEAIRFPAVELVHAALIFEHAGTGRCLENALAMVARGGRLSVVLQLPSKTQPAVSATPFPSLQALQAEFKFVDPRRFAERLAKDCFVLEREQSKALPSGKAFWLGIFKRP